MDLVTEQPGNTAPPAPALDTVSDGLDRIMRSAIASETFPGGVIVVRHRGEPVIQRAWGQLSTWDDTTTRTATPAPATLQTIYDLASITKLFTATLVMQLAEEHRLDLDDPVARYEPAFAANGKSGITIRQLLTHTAGLSPVKLWLSPGTREQRLAEASAVGTDFPAGSGMTYQDTNLIVLGDLIERIEGERQDAVLRRRVLDPLGLTHTGFGPLPPGTPGVAATEDGSYVDRGMIVGTVHDENAWALDGVAGHAGLFGSAPDLSVFGQMMLDGGSWNGARLLSPTTVAEMTRNQIGSLGERGLGWQTLHPDYMGTLASPGTFGHTGFTGTSIVVDPERELVIVVLTNRVHPTRHGPPMNPIRRQIADTVMAAFPPGHRRPERDDLSPGLAASHPGQALHTQAQPGTARPGAVRTGLDILLEDGVPALAGKRVGLITNQTGIDRTYHNGIDQILARGQLDLVSLFGPEHGIRGDVQAGDLVQGTTDGRTGLPIWSLYGETKKPTPEMLAGVDVLLLDVQDVGVRFYTVLGTLVLAQEAAAENGVTFGVLDRPNPQGGGRVDGPLLDPAFSSFVGAYPVPVSHGMTLGEMARLVAHERGYPEPLVVPLDGWARSMWFDETGLPWVPPSVNMPTLDTATLYSGTCLTEATNVSEGRGATRPFELVGAPWIDPHDLEADLERRHLPGLAFRATWFRPMFSKHAMETCGGVQIHVLDRKAVPGVVLGVHLIDAYRRLGGDAFAWHGNGQGRFFLDLLLGSDIPRHQFEAGVSVEEITDGWARDAAEFAERRRPFLIYPDTI